MCMLLFSPRISKHLILEGRLPFNSVNHMNQKAMDPAIPLKSSMPTSPLSQEVSMKDMAHGIIIKVLNYRYPLIITEAWRDD